MDLRSEKPYWLLKNGLLNAYPSLQKDIKTDILIIGTGISGALTAYHLCDTGLDVTIIDRRHAAMGSTAASTALLQYEIDVPMYELSKMIGEQNAATAYKISLDALYKLKEIAAGADVALEADIKPSLQYASFKKDVAALHDEYLLRKQYGFDVKWLDNGSISSKYGFDAPSGLYSADAMSLDAYSLTHKLLKHCNNKGMAIYDNTNVVEIIYGKNGVTVITDTGSTIKAKKVIMATGYESLKHIDKPIAKLYATYALISEPIDTKAELWHKNGVIWETATPSYLYYRVVDGNRVIVGGKDEPYTSAKKRDNEVNRKAKMLQDIFNKKFRNLTIRTDYAWAGTFATTKDGLPFIGTIPAKPHTYFALGFGGNGIVFSQVAAELLRDELMGKQNKHAALFSFNR